MDIFIKSFNRPYYLERCIKSIIINLSGNYTIKVLDDGTSLEYLNKLQIKYPGILISKSEEAPSKLKLIENHILQNKAINITTIPISLWKNAIKESKSNYFILLEDDMWLTKTFSVEELEFFMSENNFDIIKLFSFNFSKTIKWEKSIKINDTIEEIVTKFQIKPLNIYLYKFLLQNRFYCASILSKLHIYNYNWFLPIYSLYTVAGVTFNKKYWLYLWDTGFEKVNENIQLLNALKWLESSPESRFGKIEGGAQTSFISSATNMFKDVKFDTYVFNYYMNEHWYYDKLDSMQNYPNDFELHYLANFLDAVKDSRCEKSEWYRWVEKFKNQYRALGFNIK